MASNASHVIALMKAGRLTPAQVSETADRLLEVTAHRGFLARLNAALTAHRLLEAVRQHQGGGQ